MFIFGINISFFSTCLLFFTSFPHLSCYLFLRLPRANTDEQNNSIITLLRWSRLTNIQITTAVKTETLQFYAFYIWEAGINREFYESFWLLLGEREGDHCTKRPTFTCFLENVLFWKGKRGFMITIISLFLFQLSASPQSSFSSSQIYNHIALRLVVYRLHFTLLFFSSLSLSTLLK